jgi:hypothetical protein
VSYAAAVSQDGCPFCCEFLCQQTPTPTPFIDENGREVFVRGSGTFLLVIEARRGASNLEPGTTLALPFGDDRGDVQVLVSQDIGDGSPAKCDQGPPPTPFGGVPGIDPPLFGPDQDVTDAIQDMACRFTVQPIVAGSQCTRNRFGDFAYIGAGTRQQFCYQVPLTAAFHTGDTVVAMQLRDVAGHLGPKKEIVVRVLP